MSMGLSLAGVLSGAGEGASKALALAQAQYGAERLQTSRDDGENLRQQRLLEHQSKEGAATRGVAQSEGAATRKAVQENTAATLQSHEKVAGEQIAGQKEIAGEHNKTQIDIAKSTGEWHTNIAKINAAMHERVAKLQRDLQSKQFDKTFSAAKMTATTTAMKDLSDQMIHLSAEVNNAMADKTSPTYKSSVELLEKAKRLHMVYSQQLAEMISSPPGGVPGAPEFPGKVAGAQTPPPLPPFVMPPAPKALADGGIDYPVAD